MCLNHSSSKASLLTSNFSSLPIFACYSIGLCCFFTIDLFKVFDCLFFEHLSKSLVIISPEQDLKCIHPFWLYQWLKMVLIGYCPSYCSITVLYLFPWGQYTMFAPTHDFVQWLIHYSAHPLTLKANLHHQMVIDLIAYLKPT